MTEIWALAALWLGLALIAMASLATSTSVVAPVCAMMPALLPAQADRVKALLEVAESDQAGAFALPAAILVASAMWQSAGMAVTRVRRIVRGMNLEPWPESVRND